MSIRLSPTEAWSVIAAARTGILTTLRADGRPVSLPVWFVVDSHSVCVSTPTRSKKVRRVRRDPRAAFLVESGEEWRHLRAVHLSGCVHEVTDEAELGRIRSDLDEKYEAFAVPRDELPIPVRDAYRDSTVLRLVPDDKILTWDNARVRLNT